MNPLIPYFLIPVAIVVIGSICMVINERMFDCPSTYLNAGYLWCEFKKNHSGKHRHNVRVAREGKELYLEW